MFKFLLRLVDSISPATKEEITPPVQAPSNINRNTDGSFMNERQIVADLSNRVSDKRTLEWIKGNFAPTPDETDTWMADLDAACSHIAFLRWIRNSYGMWHSANPHWRIDAEPDETGVINHPLHPDNASDRIATAFVAALNAGGENN